MSSAEQLYEQGNARRRQGLWHEAINCYRQAEEIDPDSPAAEARRILEDILNFYHRDAYNP